VGGFLNGGREVSIFKVAKDQLKTGLITVGGQLLIYFIYIFNVLTRVPSKPGLSDACQR
jgi:hypothetical protein